MSRRKTPSVARQTERGRAGGVLGEGGGLSSVLRGEARCGSGRGGGVDRVEGGPMQGEGDDVGGEAFAMAEERG